ncbi:MAG: GntR family transcriptional regulator [Thermoguttaceae bacterium]
MILSLDLNSAQAIYDQVVEQVKFGIAAGAVLPDEMVPSVRELAKELAINPNTVARAYRTLQDENIVVARRGMGLAVAADAPERCREERRAIFERRFAQLVRDAVASHLPLKEIREIIRARSVSE